MRKSKRKRQTGPSAMETLRVNLIVARARAKLSQVELAEMALVSRPTISRIERGTTHISVDVVQRLADALGTSVSELFLSCGVDRPDEAELIRRASAPRSEFIEAGALMAAFDEAAGHAIQRYSKAGRPALARRSSR
jgi:transcriptional regulator with XRE-family HTH domain